MKNIIAEFIDICPKFEPVWQEHLDYWNGDERGIYNDLAEVAKFIVDCYDYKYIIDFKKIFKWIEGYLESEDEDLIGTITFGLLEDIQTIASNRPFGYVVFEEYLMPKSLIAWRNIEYIWSGKTSLMDVIRSGM